MSSILDLPDEPRRARRGLPLAIVAALVCVVAGVVFARTFALGGYLRPTFWVAMATAVPAIVVTWIAAGPHRLRVPLTVGAMVLGVLAVPIASTGATPSTARLAAIADEIGLPGEVTREQRIGDGRCQRACSEIRRTSLATNMSFAKTYAQTVGALQRAGYETKKFAYSAGAPAIIHAAEGKVLVQLELRDQGNGRTRIASIWLADGPTPDVSVG